MLRYVNLLRNLSNWHLFLANKFRLVDRDPLLFLTRQGVRIEVPQRLLQTFKEIFLDQCYLQELVLPLPETPVIFDVGANAGYFSLFALSRFPGARVFAFEPIAANFRLLKRNADLNPDQSLICIHKAVAGQSGELMLAFEGGEAYTTSATVLGSGEDKRANVRVPAVTIGEVLSEYTLPKIDLLKMDCEGAEYEIIYRAHSAVLSRIDRIVMEVHSGPRKEQRIDALESFLNGQGFATRKRPVGMLYAQRQKARQLPHL